MNMNRPRIAALIAAGALCLAVVSPTAAFAGDDDREEQSLNICQRNDSKCDNWNYFENSGYVYDGAPIVLGANSYTCPDAKTQSSTTSATATTIGSSKSWKIGGDIDFKFFSSIGAKLGASMDRGISESVTTSNSYTIPIPHGKIGYMTFTPKMYYSEGQMNWTLTDVASEFHEKYDYKTQVESRSPMTVQSGAADGVYGLTARDMDAKTLKDYCGYVAPTPTPAPAPAPAPAPNPCWRPGDISKGWSPWDVNCPIN